VRGLARIQQNNFAGAIEDIQIKKRGRSKKP
jgi:hypothetical protein